MNKKGKSIIYSLLTLLFLLITVVSVYNLTMIYKKASDSGEKLLYSKTKKIDYNVNVIENDFVLEDKLAFGKAYISKISKSIDFDFSFTYEGDEVLDLNTSHEIKAKIVGIYNKNPGTDGNPVIWEKNVPIKKLENKKSNGTSTTINEKFQILLDPLHREAIKFRNDLEIPTLVYLEIKMPVSIEGTSSKYKLKEDEVIEAKFNIGDKVFEVTAHDNSAEKKVLPSLIQVKVNHDKETIFYTTILIISLFLCWIFIKHIPYLYREFSYKDYIESLKFDYDEIIVETQNMIDIRNYSSIFITSFKEMMNLSQNLETPIILFERSNFSVFYIINEKIIYLYFVKNEKKALKQILDNE